MADQTGAGDVEKSLQLMWRDKLPVRRTRGPKPSLTVDRIVEAAIELADRVGVEGLSMRGLAESLGVGVMSLYNHVPSKAELLDVMTDQVLGELYPKSKVPGDDWRMRLAAIGRANLELCLRHPWLVQVSTVRPPIGPNSSAKYEIELVAIDGVGFSDLDMDSVVGLVNGHAVASARVTIDAQKVAASTSMSDLQWWEINAPFLEQVMAGEDFPVSSRVGAVAGEFHQAAVSPSYAFEFGLERILDGVAALRG